MTHTPEIRTNADGSINTAHYIALGRNARSAQAHHLTHKVARTTVLTLPRLTGVIVLAVLLLPLAL